ncbi:MAG TPA: glutamine--tRNA ligase/YqeY domain fusion protein [Bacteroidales bacterium]|jgi:glutaminyl-tRNA synthetase|nr:glutamine--tRNA ligase/YqeY domain fusion protein [Bacteroidales bacterium]HPY21215.1 glutamine--tRNA ligase/YqeY domain fusion protein [Bacteroidales bacterium]HQA92603.1 glutamine--tRNA ligase/YqeY domain fusion protein [Bacteroidales bacterium]HQN23653.1 glutamine--tRNA ligase/YqeY domain fusion protein [Bacteroidales bacterium]HQP78797.1 glutamine--tRNA ligase/YqeY domain fusion protein [Bacteroidales bacterium]
MEEIINNETPERNLNFIEEIIEDDLASGKHDSIITRFPPEPNGYLHIGHAKSICLNFGLALKYGGYTNLRFDDTNPVKEDVEYVDSIKEDIKWLGFEWVNELYASDYFEQLYQWAIFLIKKGLAYVDDQTQEEIRTTRGTISTPGVESPWRNRSVEENLRLFEEMREGKYAEGDKVLRAKIDMAHPNMLMRDPLMYRIIHASHHRTGDKWCIYPMYDYAHGQCDSIERITHSICTLEFDVHRPLYDWFIENLEIFPSRQYEFARLNLTYTVMSKRKLLELVNNNFVDGWDDPRMPTICGLRRRGYTPESIRLFAEKVGVAKRDNVIDLSLLEWCLRDDLNRRSNRYMAVINPVKLVIDNWEEGKVEYFEAPMNPEYPDGPKRRIPFTKEMYIESEDFMEEAPKRYHRLKPNGEVRLKYSYIVKCVDYIKNEAGEVVEIHCTYDPTSKPGAGPWRSVKGTIHWVSVPHSENITVNLFDKLFTEEQMGSIPEGKDYREYLNPDSLVVKEAFAEPDLLKDESGIAVQFERIGYFKKDPKNGGYNKATGLRDSFKL